MAGRGITTRNTRDMNSYRPAWLDVDGRRSMSTMVSIAVLRFLTGVLTRLTAIIWKLTTPKAVDPEAARLTAIRAMIAMARRHRVPINPSTSGLPVLISAA